MTTSPTNIDDFRNRLKDLVPTVIAFVPCTLILPFNVLNYAITLLCALWLYLTISSKTLQFRFKKNGWAILYLVYFGLQVLSVLYSENFAYGIRKMETKVPFLIFPLLFFSGYNIIEKVDQKKTLFVFTQSICLICLFILVKILLSSHDIASAWHEYTFKNLSGIISVHPGYFSLCICFSVLILLTQFSYYSLAQRVLIFGEICLFILFIFRLASRMPIIGLVVCLIVYILFERKYILLLVSTVGGILGFFLLTENSPDIKERYLAPLSFISTGNLEGLKAYVLDRTQIYSCAIEVLSGPSLLTGVGAGDANQSLIQCYDQHGYEWVSSQEYNAHNEFLQSTLETGICGGIIFTILLVWPSRLWAHQKEFFLFTILFCIFSLTESTLQVQKGVVFFTFFHTFFSSMTIKSQIRQNEKIKFWNYRLRQNRK